MSTTSRFSTLVFNSQEHAHLTPYLAGIHGECITSDKMIGSFMSPLSIEKMLKWWKDRIAEVTSGTRVIVMLLCSADTTAKIEAKHLVGSVMLSIPHSETSPFRGAIESLLVSSKYRGQGGASTLLQAVEEQANIKGKTLVVRKSPVFLSASTCSTNAYLCCSHSWRRWRVGHQLCLYSRSMRIKKLAGSLDTVSSLTLVSAETLHSCTSTSSTKIWERTLISVRVSSCRCTLYRNAYRSNLTTNYKAPKYIGYSVFFMVVQIGPVLPARG